MQRQLLTTHLLLTDCSPTARRSHTVSLKVDQTLRPNTDRVSLSAVRLLMVRFFGILVAIQGALSFSLSLQSLKFRRWYSCGHLLIHLLSVLLFIHSSPSNLLFLHTLKTLRLLFLSLKEYQPIRHVCDLFVCAPSNRHTHMYITSFFVAAPDSISELLLIALTCALWQFALTIRIVQLLDAASTCSLGNCNTIVRFLYDWLFSIQCIHYNRLERRIREDQNLKTQIKMEPKSTFV